MNERNRTSQPAELLPLQDGENTFGDGGDAGLVQVAAGLYAERLPVDGMTVESVRRHFGDRLDIDPQAVAVIDGRRVEDETTVVHGGQQLAFVRASGEKGRRR